MNNAAKLRRLPHSASFNRGCRKQTNIKETTWFYCFSLDTGSEEQVLTMRRESETRARYQRSNLNIWTVFTKRICVGMTEDRDSVTMSAVRLNGSRGPDASWPSGHSSSSRAPVLSSSSLLFCISRKQSVEDHIIQTVMCKTNPLNYIDM